MLHISNCLVLQKRDRHTQKTDRQKGRLDARYHKVGPLLAHLPHLPPRQMVQYMSDICDCLMQLPLLASQTVSVLCCTERFQRPCRSSIPLCKCWALMETYPSRWLQSASPHQFMRLWWMTHQLHPGALAQSPHHLSSFPRVLALAAVPQRLGSGGCHLPCRHCLF